MRIGLRSLSRHTGLFYKVALLNGYSIKYVYSSLQFKGSREEKYTNRGFEAHRSRLTLMAALGSIIVYVYIALGICQNL